MGDEPTSFPATSGDGHVRVTDQERDAAIDSLATAATDGRLNLDEYSARTDQALVSVTRDDLARLTHDLAPAPSASLTLPADGAEPERVVAIFGSEHRRGRWMLPPRLKVRALFGECKVELQQATLHSRVTVVEAKATFGSVEILVPTGVDVRMSGSAIFGSRSCDIEDEPPPGAPIIEIRGRAMFGEIKVRHPRWT